MNNTFSYSSTFVETLMDNADDGIVIFSPIEDEHAEITDFKYHFINKAGANIISRKREEIQKLSLKTAFPQFTYDNIFKKYKEVFVSGKPYVSEQFYSDEGLQRWYRISVKKVDDFLLVKFNDISGIKSLLSENSLSVSLYRTLIRSLPHADVALIDLDLNLLLVEGSPFKAFGFNQSIEEDSNLAEEFSHEAKATIIPLIKSCLDGNSKKLEKESEGALFRVHILSVKDEKGDVFAALIVSEDIGIFNISKEELRNKIYELESSNQSLEQFAYVASHDLQEPLRKIRAFGDRLQSKYSEAIDETGRDYINRMQNAASRMQRLIDDLLKYSRVGRFKDPFQRINLHHVIDRVLEDLENRVEDSGANISVEQLPEIDGDAGALEQLFLNLLSNAIKFRKPGIQPNIRIWSEEQTDTNELGKSSLKYNIFVQDNGIGFDEKYLDRIFNIFQRLHGRNEYAGTGIGLAICKKIVENHGGTIYAKSTPGEQTTFIVTLPMTQEDIT